MPFMSLSYLSHPRLMVAYWRPIPIQSALLRLDYQQTKKSPPLLTAQRKYGRSLISHLYVIGEATMNMQAFQTFIGPKTLP